MRGEFNFDPKKYQTKHCYLITKTDEEIIIDKIIQGLNNPMNDEYYIEHPVGYNAFTLKQEDSKK